MNIPELIEKAITKICELFGETRKLLNSQLPLLGKTNMKEEIRYEGGKESNFNEGKDSKALPEMLIKLGANEDIVNNPLVAKQLREACLSMLRLRGMTNLKELEGIYTEEERMAIEKGISQCRVLSKEQADQCRKSKNKYMGIEIDSQTGTITIQDFSYSPGAEGQRVAKSNEIKTFSIDERNNVTVTTSKEDAIFINKNGILGELEESGYVKTNGKTVIDSDGILQRRETKKQFEGENEGIKGVIEIRDPKYPLIVSVGVKESGSDGAPNIRYYPISPRAVSGLEYCNVRSNSQEGHISFDTRDEAIQYCNDRRAIYIQSTQNQKTLPGDIKILRRTGILNGIPEQVEELGEK